MSYQIFGTAVKGLKMPDIKKRTTNIPSSLWTSELDYIRVRGLKFAKYECYVLSSNKTLMPLH